MAGLYSVDLSSVRVVSRIPSECLKFVLRSVTGLTIAWDEVHESQQHKGDEKRVGLGH